jgi:hypothetical protein
MGAAANSDVRLSRTVPINRIAMQGLVISESTTVFALPLIYQRRLWALAISLLGCPIFGYPA